MSSATTKLIEFGQVGAAGNEDIHTDEKSPIEIRRSRHPKPTNGMAGQGGKAHSRKLLHPTLGGVQRGHLNDLEPVLRYEKKQGFRRPCGLDEEPQGCINVNLVKYDPQAAGPQKASKKGAGKPRPATQNSFTHKQFIPKKARPSRMAAKQQRHHRGLYDVQEREAEGARSQLRMDSEQIEHDICSQLYEVRSPEVPAGQSQPKPPRVIANSGKGTRERKKNQAQKPKKEKKPGRLTSSQVSSRLPPAGDQETVVFQDGATLNELSNIQVSNELCAQPGAAESHLVGEALLHHQGGAEKHTLGRRNPQMISAVVTNIQNVEVGDGDADELQHQRTSQINFENQEVAQEIGELGKAEQSTTPPDNNRQVIKSAIHCTEKAHTSNVSPPSALISASIDPIYRNKDKPVSRLVLQETHSSQAMDESKLSEKFQLMASQLKSFSTLELHDMMQHYSQMLQDANSGKLPDDDRLQPRAPDLVNSSLTHDKVIQLVA